MAEGNHSFTEQDIRKRFGAIVGHAVTEVDTAGVLTASAAFLFSLPPPTLFVSFLTVFTFD